MTKTDFDVKQKSLNQKINSNKTRHILVKNEFKRYKHLSQFILEVKVKKMVQKVIWYFSQCTDILRGLLILIIF